MTQLNNTFSTVNDTPLKGSYFKEKATSVINPYRRHNKVQISEFENVGGLSICTNMRIE